MAVNVIYYISSRGKTEASIQCCAGVAELADARDLKSRVTRVTYRFKPGLRH